MIIVAMALLLFALRAEAQTPPAKTIDQMADRRFEHIKLQLRTIADAIQRTDKTQFCSNEDVTVQVLANNSGSTQISLAYWKSFIHYLPALSRAGEIVPYSKAMEKQLTDVEAREKQNAEPGSLVRDSAIVARLAPNQLSESGLISLSNYYDKLTPGIYELKVKFRERTGFTIESDAIMFEVIN